MKKLFLMLTALLPIQMFGQAMDEILEDFINFHGLRIEIAVTDFNELHAWSITCRAFDNRSSSDAKVLEKEKTEELLALLGKLQEADSTEIDEDFLNHRIPESSAFMHLADVFCAIPKLRRERNLRDSLKTETRRALDENLPLMETPRGKIYKLEPFARIFKDYIRYTPTEDFVYFEYPIPIDVRAKITLYPMSSHMFPKAIYLDYFYVFFEGKLYDNTEELRNFLSKYK